MPNKATPEDFKIYHIFLASPGDMTEERQMVREFFDRYNRNTANPHQLEFKVIDWENYSSIGLGRPQELITRQTLEKFKNSLVLFIGLLGQRFGTPTGGYDSGTEEEFYRSHAPAARGNVSKSSQYHTPFKRTYGCLAQW